MPWLLVRYLLGELLRVFAISAGVLVMITAFGAAIKPLAAEDLIGPLQTAKYITLAIVPMLQFALPFAAGFAATLVMHRLTTDNEVTAAAVSGISYRRILFPIVSLGVALLLLMVLLTQSIIPRFWALMDRHLAADMSNVVLASIEKGIPFRVGNNQILADRGRIVDSPADTGAETRLLLARVVAARLDDEGRIELEVTAANAAVDLHRNDEGRTTLKLIMTETTVFNAKTGELIYTPEFAPKAIHVPAPLRDDPMFMTQGELVRLHRNPRNFGPVAESKEKLASALQQAVVWRAIDRRLQEDGQVQFSQGDVHITIAAERLRDRYFVNGDGSPVEIRRLEHDQVPRKVTARRAWIRAATDYQLDALRCDLMLQDCEVSQLGAEDNVNYKAELAFPGIVPIAMSPPIVAADSCAELLEAASMSEDGNVAVRAEELARRVRVLELEIRARLLRRYAMSLMAMLLPILGAVLAMWLRDNLPLVIYIWAFAPSILDVLLISGGEHMIRDDQVVPGIIVMWMGNVVLGGALLFSLLKLVKN